MTNDTQHKQGDSILEGPINNATEHVISKWISPTTTN